MSAEENYTKLYGTEGLKDFQHWYSQIHGYTSTVVCVIGIIFNILNILVLTRKNMISSTNCILAGLAVSDMLTMISYIPFAVHYYCIYGHNPYSPERNSYQWARFLMFHANFSNITHTCSIWLGVLLSVFRYIFVKFAAERAHMLSLTRTRIAVVMVYIGAIVILIPNALTLYIAKHPHPQSNKTLYILSQLDKSNVIVLSNFWIHAVLIKLLPCALLSIFGYLLICTMHVTYKRRQRLRSLSSGRQSRSRRTREHSRTTRMLVVVIILFLVTELPQGILALLSGVKEGFYEAVYTPLGDLMDIMALINNAINFTLYCSMSKQFRDTFLKMVCGRGPKKFLRQSVSVN